MAAINYFGIRTKVLFSFLLAALSIAACAPNAFANESDASALVFIHEQLVDVDDDGIQERFGARFSVMKDGTIIGSAIVHDGQKTTQYNFEPGKISCDNIGQRFVQLDTQILGQNGDSNVTMTFGTATDDGYVIWENMSSGFNVKGQMITITNPCPTPMPWLTWII